MTDSIFSHENDGPLLTFIGESERAAISEPFELETNLPLFLILGSPEFEISSQILFHHIVLSYQISCNFFFKRELLPMAVVPNFFLLNGTLIQWISKWGF